MTSRHKIAIVLSLVVLNSGCLREFARSLAEARAVQHELRNKYGDTVEVSTTDFRNRITVVIVFTDSTLNNQTHEIRARRALESAQIAQKKYSVHRPPDGFVVRFDRDSPDGGVFASPEYIDLFEFDRELRALKREPPAASRVVDTVSEPSARAVFIEHAGESDIATPPITLDGLPGQGLSIIPHFTVTGDANKQKAVPPKTVSFDFAAYYPFEKFKDEIEFKFIVDEESVLSTKGRFTQTPEPGVVTQFCYLKIPYAGFARIIKGETLTIRVGDEAYQLTDTEYESLKKMTTFLR